MSRRKVLPCPFCGSKATYRPERFESTYGTYNEYVSCTSCPAQIGDPVRGRIKEPLKLWNTRLGYLGEET